MNLKQIEVFRVVMTNGTTARAAEILHVSQPAVSKMIQELERSLGFDLFRRIKGRLHPTPEGQLFFQEVEHAFLGLSHLRGAAARIRDYGSGELKIACLSALSTNVLPRALKAFMDRNPRIAVTFQARMSSNVRDLVGKPVAFGAKGSGLVFLSRYVLDGIGLDHDKDFQAIYLDRAGDGPATPSDTKE